MFKSSSLRVLSLYIRGNFGIVNGVAPLEAPLEARPVEEETLNKVGDQQG
jgi:hypothetical protein